MPDHSFKTRYKFGNKLQICKRFLYVFSPMCFAKSKTEYFMCYSNVILQVRFINDKLYAYVISEESLAVAGCGCVRYMVVVV